ncbi:ankyrin repeat domain-containing protein [bacterium]|nr:ankyrin repeat domain-containing protein [bacterium]
MLYVAVCAEDFRRVLKMVRAGANVNQEFGHGWTPIVSAAVARNRRICEILLAHGADPNRGEQASSGALSHACGRDSDSVAIIKLLVEHGVPPDRLVHAAARNGTVRMVGQLLRRGADPNLLNDHGHPPLRDARSPAVIRELFRFGANPLAYSADCEHPLHYNAVRGRGRNVRALLAGGVPPDHPEPGPPDKPEIGEAYALHMAVNGKRFRCARVLLEAGANPELLSCYHTRTPLMTACRRGLARLVELLLKHGADPKRRINDDTARSEALLGLEQNPERKRSYRKILGMLPSTDRGH